MMTTKRGRRGQIRSRSSAKSEVDAAGSESVKHGELFGDDQGRVVGEHDAPSAQSDPAGFGCQAAEHELRRRRRRGWHRVVLRHPEAMIATTFGYSRKINDVFQCILDGLPDRGVGIVEN